MSVCPSCSHIFSGEGAITRAEQGAAVQIQRVARGKVIRTMLTRLKRSMRPSQLVRARSAVGLGKRAPQPPPWPESPPHLGITRLSMSRPSSARVLSQQTRNGQPLVAERAQLDQTQPTRRRPGTSPGRRRAHPKPQPHGARAALLHRLAPCPGRCLPRAHFIGAQHTRGVWRARRSRVSAHTRLDARRAARSPPFPQNMAPLATARMATWHRSAGSTRSLTSCRRACSGARPRRRNGSARFCPRPVGPHPLRTCGAGAIGWN